MDGADDDVGLDEMEVTAEETLGLDGAVKDIDGVEEEIVLDIVDGETLHPPQNGGLGGIGGKVKGGGTGGKVIGERTGGKVKGGRTGGKVIGGRTGDKPDIMFGIFESSVGTVPTKLFASKFILAHEIRIQEKEITHLFIEK